MAESLTARRVCLGLIGWLAVLMTMTHGCGVAEETAGHEPVAAAETRSGDAQRAPAEGAGDPPNIVLIIGDDHGWPYYGFLGDENVVTPNLDRIAAEGMLFTLAHATSNHCRPTLQSLVTGLHPVQYARRADALTEARLANDPDYQAASPAERERHRLEVQTGMMTEFATLPRLLAERGYVSFQGGKWWEQSFATAGFTHGMTHGWRRQAMAQEGWFHKFMGDFGIELGRSTMRPLLDFIDQEGDKPFFVWYGPSLPHVPFDAPPEHLRHYEHDRFSRSAREYYGNITWFDAGIGTLLKALDAKGVLEKTLIVYINDNGWEQPADAEYADNPDLYANGGTRGKSSLFDTAFRTPVIFHWPGRIDAGRDDQVLVSSLDLMPTILDYVGLRAPAGLHGESLRPAVEGRPFDGRRFLIGHASSHRGDSTIRGEPIGASGDFMGRDIDAYYLRSRRWHFIWVHDTGETALFDMGADPDAREDVAAAHPDLVAGFKLEIEAWRQDMS